ncbi:HTH-type transcriptional regulator DmlR [Vibrio stylophorae]|uniref:HTH-type transcriptional regulator DmlR n=1 Tax=Vibrio stylophorae TaxID=659351 RepID=A0ABN8DQT8_9VIBR|nr:LysR family transcriptional regulator [Vibrio stylophorae]CAH0533536.1 HTH-type transcriptional regulator DmlR [Vibrio stylophorae]
MAHIDDLVLFTQVVEHGSFVSAAKAQQMTTSAVSKRISKLETELGVQLLYRTTRKLTLTEAGEVLYHRGRDIQHTAKSAFDAVTGFNQALSGHIRMSVPTISGELLLAEAVADFCNQHPGLTVEMSLDNHFVDLLSEHYDLVIRTGYLEDSTLIARYIFDSRWLVCASPEYLASHEAIQSPKDLLRHNCLGYSYETGGTFDWQFQQNNDTYLLKVKGNFASDNAAALRKAVLAGHGLAYLPSCLIYQDLQAGTLKEVLVEHTNKVLGIYAVYPYTKQPAKRIQALIEHIRQAYIQIQPQF